jgi:hypothetical protein
MFWAREATGCRMRLVLNLEDYLMWRASREARVTHHLQLSINFDLTCVGRLDFHLTSQSGVERHSIDIDIGDRSL